LRDLPRLTPDITEAAIFLYTTIHDAEERVGWGGSGFMVGVPSEARPDHIYLYAVSNEHVSTRGPIIRLTRADGEAEIIPAAPEDWIAHPTGEDVAVRPLGLVPAIEERFRRMGIPTPGYRYLDAARLITIQDFDLGVGPSIGDECLMVGRYVNHGGKQFDRAAVRFGNLSMFPEPVRQEQRAHEQEIPRRHAIRLGL
jgi:hypothetical protein